MQESKIIVPSYNIFSEFFKYLKDWFKKDVYPYQENYDIALYENAIRSIMDNNDEGMKIVQKKYPYVIFEPDLNLQMDQRTSFFWKFSKYEGLNLADKLNNPIFTNDYVQIVPISNTIEGMVNIHLLFESIYQLLDQAIILQDKFENQSMQRSKMYEPWDFNVIIPPELFNLTYYDDQKNIHKLEWEEKSGLTKVNKVNQQETFIKFFQINPIITPASLSDGTQIKSKQIQNEFRLTLQLQYSISIPTSFIINCKTKIINYPNIRFEFNSEISSSSDITMDNQIYKFIKNDEFIVTEEQLLGDIFKISLSKIYDDNYILRLNINGEIFNEFELFDQIYIKKEYLQQGDKINVLIYKKWGDIL